MIEVSIRANPIVLGIFSDLHDVDTSVKMWKHLIILSMKDFHKKYEPVLLELIIDTAENITVAVKSHEGNHTKEYMQHVFGMITEYIADIIKNKTYIAPLSLTQASTSIDTTIHTSYS